MSLIPTAISHPRQKRPTRIFRLAPLIAGALLSVFLAAESQGSETPVRYELDLRQPATHRAAVTMTVPQAAPRTRVQFPAWNALYQIRDFVRNVEGLTAACDGAPAKLERLDLYTWQSGERTCERLEVRYRVYANEEGPFSSVVNSEHAFLNLAMVLFYLPDQRERPARIRFEIPQGWKLATLLEEMEGEFPAGNYDELVDSPVEAGMFQEHEFVEGNARYRVVVHAMGESYKQSRLLNSLRRIVRAATELMQDVPFRRFTFLIHFRPDASGAAMEHRDGTALDSSRGLTWESFESLAAHEFLHAWVVKRIRPAKLEPVDYVHGNDTRDLWFAEGLVSAYQRYVLLRAGLISDDEFHRQFASEIARLEQRPARRSISVEQAGLEAWLEKYPDYLRPERSISYYNKGALVSFLLDLAIRHSTGNRRSLDDVLRRLNDEFARQGRYFTREDLIGVILRVAPEFHDVEDFFSNYIEGTRDLDYETYLGYAGLKLETKTEERASVGFTTTRGFGGPPTVDSIDSEGAAAQAGLAVGDELVSIEGRRVPRWPDEELARLRPGRTLRLRVRRGGRELDLEFTVGRTQVTTYRIEEKRAATSLEREVRRGILTGAVSAAAEVKGR
jgi:predicted metalloprotease with PDZ domain